MATNKNATIRYQTLDRYFRNPGRRYYIDDLIDACNESLLDVDPSSSGVKKRQIFDDIKFMRDSRGFNAPIESFKDGKKVFYRYNVLNFSINNQPLNEQEAQQLKEALVTLSRFKGLPQFEWIEEMQVRLEQTFHLKSNKKAIEFDENPFLKGREHIGELYNSIIDHRALKMQYQPFSGEILDVVISPYYLKEYNNRWFLFAFNHRENKIMNLALDRIIYFEHSKEEFIPNIANDFDEYFEDIVGVTKPNDPELIKIELKVDKGFWPYIKTKPIHGSQIEKVKKDQYSIIQLELIPNYEFEALLLSFGDNIEVISPKSLRNKIRERINLLQAKYLD